MTAKHPGRPKAVDLKHRCEGFNRLGKRCGLAPIEGETVCTYHLGEVDREVKQSMAERLRQGADEAVARLRLVIKTGQDADAVRASEILLSRVAPKLSSSQAIVVSVDGNGSGDGAMSSREIIDRRLRELAAATRAPQEEERERDEEMIIDAELVEETAS